MEYFWIVAAGIVFAWGLIMVISPERFWSLAIVDWNADVIDPHHHRMRSFVRIAGVVAVVMSGSMLWGLLRDLLRSPF